MTNKLKFFRYYSDGQKAIPGQCPFKAKSALTDTRPTASRLSPVDLAVFLARKDLADFVHEVLLDFLAYSFAHSVNNILSYLNKTNLPIIEFIGSKFRTREKNGGGGGDCKAP